MDSFLKSRQSKGNFKTELEVRQEKEETSGDENLNETTFKDNDATQSFTQDDNHPTTDAMPQPSTPLAAPPPEAKQNSGYRKRTTSAANLSDVNTSAFKYFETKKKLLEQKQCGSSTLPDPDMAFVRSILPEMKAMNERQMRKFKLGVMQLADDIINDTVVPSSISSVATFNYTPSPVDGYNTLDGNITEDGNTSHC